MKNEEIGHQNPIQEILQKIRNSLIHKRKRDGKFQSLNWFHILTARLRWLNPFRKQYGDYKRSYWSEVRYFFYNYYLEDYMEWLRYRTDLAFRLDKKIEKVVKQHIAETDWINFYEHETYGGPGLTYPHTCINVKEEQSEDTYYNWKRNIQNKIYDIGEVERQYALASGYLSNFIKDYFDESVHFFACHDWRNDHWCNDGASEPEEVN